MSAKEGKIGIGPPAGSKQCVEPLKIVSSEIRCDNCKQPVEPEWVLCVRCLGSDEQTAQEQMRGLLEELVACEKIPVYFAYEQYHECPFCDAWTEGAGFKHNPDCLIERAKETLEETS